MKTKPKPDVNKGANAMKTRVVAYLKRILRRLEAKHGEGTLATLGTKQTLRWLGQTDERAGKKAGGIGRK